jgi:F-type H+-transporting ATPase subunit epsilon
MADQLHLEIITPAKTVLETDADWVTVPGSEGELGVLPEHVPVVSTLDSGLLKFGSESGTTLVAVHYGYVQVQGLTVTVLSDMAERAEEIDLSRAKDAEQRARQALQEMIAQQKEEEHRIRKNEAKLKRATVRLSLGE